MVLFRPFYLNNVLVTPDIIKNLLYICQFTTNNWCSIEFDPFGLSVKDLATRNMITRCNSSGPLYTICLSTTHPPQASTYYAITTAAIPTSLWHCHLSHLGPDALSKLSTSFSITCNKPRDVLPGSSTPGTMGHQLWPKILDTTGSLQQQMAGEPYTPYGYSPTTPG
jgi:hypothetical protein